MAKTKEPTLLIWIESETLSDGSKVYNVILNETKFAATDEDAAESLAADLCETINANSNETADWLRQE